MIFFLKQNTTDISNCPFHQIAIKCWQAGIKQYSELKFRDVDAKNTIDFYNAQIKKYSDATTENNKQNHKIKDTIFLLVFMIVGTIIMLSLCVCISNC